MDRRTLLLSAGALALAFGGAGLAAWVTRPSTAVRSAGARLVSLSPGVTETLFALGRGDALVGRSTFCTFPPEALGLPDAGTSLTPALEVIASLVPSALLVEEAAASAVDALRGLAPVELLPWLTVDEVVGSVRRLGALVGRRDAAEGLAAEFAALGAPPPSGAPRVLLALAAEDLGRGALWYMRPRSLHGAALHAAGFRNAVEPDPPGPPQLSLERLVALDPDAIVVLSAEPLDAAAEARVRASFDALEPLSAVRARRVGLLSGPEHLRTGPSALALVDALRVELARIGVAP